MEHLPGSVPALLETTAVVSLGRVFPSLGETALDLVSEAVSSPSERGIAPGPEGEAEATKMSTTDIPATRVRSDLAFPMLVPVEFQLGAGAIS